MNMKSTSITQICSFCGPQPQALSIWSANNRNELPPSSVQCIHSVCCIPVVSPPPH